MSARAGRTLIMDDAGHLTVAGRRMFPTDPSAAAEALDHLEAEDPRKARVVRMRVEDSATFPEIGRAIGLCAGRAAGIYYHAMRILSSRLRRGTI